MAIDTETWLHPVTLTTAKGNAMRYLLVLLLVFGTLVPGVSHADTSHDFVRITCVPENGLLDVEYRSLHDSVAGKPGAEKSGVATALSNAGFHHPRGLRFTCDLDGVNYVIAAEQAETSNFMCGGSPDIVLNVTRNGIGLFTDVIFGASCKELPSLMRFTIGDGANSWRGRETRACYASGNDRDTEICEWTFGPQQAWLAPRFPVDQKAIARIVIRPKLR